MTYTGDVKIIRFHAVYDALKNHLNITAVNCPYFQLLSDDELRSPFLNWAGDRYSTGDLCSINEVLTNYGDTTIWSSDIDYVSGY